MFPWSDRRPAQPTDADLAARHAATQAFLAMDAERGGTADAVRVAEDGAPEPDGRLAREWEPVVAACDAATEAYLTAIRDFPLDGTGPTRGSRAADERALSQIERARAAIERFGAAHRRALDAAAHALATLPDAVAQARAAVVRARSEVERATAAGARSARAEDRLAEAERALPGLEDRGAGVAARRRTAGRVTELARTAADLAEDAPRRAARLRASLASVATRSAATEDKVCRLATALSDLRREFAEPCSRDLTGAEQAARAELAEAQAALARATDLTAAGDTDAATAGIAQARAALARAEERFTTVTTRLADLRAVRADPRRVLAETRFVVRDAQRLVVDRGLVDRFGRVLDAQSARLERAERGLTGHHPDYWAYLSELRAVRDRVRGVVDDVRAVRAGR